MILSTHPLAADELVDGAMFYARQATAELAGDFIAGFERSVALLQPHPKLGPVWRGRFRRLPLRRFPCSIVPVRRRLAHRGAGSSQA
jgi:hypothetical protein